MRRFTNKIKKNIKYILIFFLIALTVEFSFYAEEYLNRLSLKRVLVSDKHKILLLSDSYGKVISKNIYDQIDEKKYEFINDMHFRRNAEEWAERYRNIVGEVDPDITFLLFGTLDFTDKVSLIAKVAKIEDYSLHSKFLEYIVSRTRTGLIFNAIKLSTGYSSVDLNIYAKIKSSFFRENEEEFIALVVNQFEKLPPEEKFAFFYQVNLELLQSISTLTEKQRNMVHDLDDRLYKKYRLKQKKLYSNINENFIKGLTLNEIKILLRYNSEVTRSLNGISSARSFRNTLLGKDSAYQPPEEYLKYPYQIIRVIDAEKTLNIKNDNVSRIVVYFKNRKKTVRKIKSLINVELDQNIINQLAASDIGIANWETIVLIVRYYQLLNVPNLSILRIEQEIEKYTARLFGAESILAVARNSVLTAEQKDLIEYYANILSHTKKSSGYEFKNKRDEFKEKAKIYFNSVRKINEEAKKNGSKLVVMLFPWIEMAHVPQTLKLDDNVQFIELKRVIDPLISKFGRSYAFEDSVDFETGHFTDATSHAITGKMVEIIQRHQQRSFYDY